MSVNQETCAWSKAYTYLASHNYAGIKQLLDGGFSLDEANKYGVPLINQMIHDHRDARYVTQEVLERIRLLLQLGASANIKLPGEPQPLSRAVNYSMYSVAELLLEHGAKPHGEKQRSHFPPLFSAIHRGNYDIVKLLLKHKVRLHKGPEQYALSEACKRGNYAIAKLLLEAGASVTYDTPPGRTSITSYLQQPLAEAVLINHPELVELLLDHGAPFDEQLAYVAAERGNDRSVKVLNKRFDLDLDAILNAALCSYRTVDTRPGHKALVAYVLLELKHQPSNDSMPLILRELAGGQDRTACEIFRQAGVVIHQQQYDQAAERQPFPLEDDERLFLQQYLTIVP